MEGSPFDVEKRSKDRVDLNRKVQLRFDKFQEFLSEVAGNISPGGMFVRSDDPHPPGEQFEFECSLADGYPLVSGRAEVVWVRKSATASEPRGMGVRFISLNDKSEELIRRIVAERLEAGEEAFELDAADSTAELEWLPAAPDVTSEILTAAEGLVEEEPRDAGARAEPSESSAGAGSDDLIFAQAADLELIDDPASAAAVPLEPAEPIEPPGPPPAPPKPRQAPEVPETRQARAKASRPAPPAAAPVPPPVMPAREEPPQRESGSTAARPGERSAVELPETLRDLSQPQRSEPSPPPVRRAVGSVPRPRPRRPRIAFGRFVELVVFSVLAGACMVLVFNQYWVRPRIEGLEAKLEELTGSSLIGGPPGIKRAAVSGEAVPVGGEETSVQEDSEDSEVAPPPVTFLEIDSDRPSPALARTVVSDWAKAWSEQRVDDYLAHYSAAFVPASGVSRAAWEQRRRERLLAQGDIRVAVVSLDLEEVSPSEVVVSFTQSYRSNVFRDRVRKNLRMAWETEDWKIVEETVIRQMPW